MADGLNTITRRGKSDILSVLGLRPTRCPFLRTHKESEGRQFHGIAARGNRNLILSTNSIKCRRFRERRPTLSRLQNGYASRRVRNRDIVEFGVRRLRIASSGGDTVNVVLRSLWCAEGAAGWPQSQDRKGVPISAGAIWCSSHRHSQAAHQFNSSDRPRIERGCDYGSCWMEKATDAFRTISEVGGRH